jgi:hypothetical protein
MSILRSCLDLFPDHPDGFSLPPEQMQALAQHLRENFQTPVNFSLSSHGLRILWHRDADIPPQLLPFGEVRHLALASREELESQLQCAAPGYEFKMALLDAMPLEHWVPAFLMALREDVDILVTGYDPALMTPRHSLLEYLHTAAETGHLVVVIGPPIAHD